MWSIMRELVRGKTQRIIKLEISGQPEDGMIQDIEALVDGLRNGNGELGWCAR